MRTIRKIAEEMVDPLCPLAVRKFGHEILGTLDNSREVTEKVTKPHCSEHSHVVSYTVTSHKARVVLDD